MSDKDNDFYRALLLKYISHVESSEGTVFLTDHYRDVSKVKFTEDEWTLLGLFDAEQYQNWLKTERPKLFEQLNSDD